MNEYGHVYVITNTVNDKKYVGQSIDWHTRCADELRYPHNSHYRRAVTKYGIESFTSSSFAVAYNAEELNELEVYAINEFKTLDPQYGYNKREGGAKGRHTTQTKELLRQKATEQMGRPGYREALRARQLGSTASQATRQRMSNSQAKPYPSLRHTVTGEVIPAGSNLLALCKQYGFQRTGITRVIKGTHKTHKQWQINTTENTE